MNLTVFKYAFLRGAKRPMTMLVNFILPFVIMIFMVGEYGAGLFSDARDEAYYLLALSLMFGAFFLGRGIQSDRMDGTIIRILAGPVRMKDYLVQNFFSSMLPTVVLVSVLMGLGMFLHDWNIGFAALLGLVYILLAATSIGLSFTWSCIFKNTDASYSVFSIFLTMVAMLGGFIIPLDMLPPPLFHFGALFPAHWASRAIGNLTEFGAGGVEPIFWLALLAMVLFSAAYLLYGGKRRLI